MPSVWVEKGRGVVLQYPVCSVYLDRDGQYAWQAVTKLTVEPMLSFITKVTAVKVAGGGSADTKSLRDQVRFSIQKVLC